MLNYALNLDLVTLPLNAVWPAPLSLSVAFNEVVLIEGAGPAVSSPLLEVAATLASPVAGHVRHWGRDAAMRRREKLYRLRRRIAYISPQQVLLHLMTLAENIALGPCYYQGCSEAEALALHADLLEQLELQAHLTQYPPQVSAAIYDRAVWARELVKGPELILAVISGESRHHRRGRHAGQRPPGVPGPVRGRRPAAGRVPGSLLPPGASALLAGSGATPQTDDPGTPGPPPDGLPAAGIAGGDTREENVAGFLRTYLECQKFFLLRHSFKLPPLVILRKRSDRRISKKRDSSRRSEVTNLSNLRFCTSLQ